MTRGLRVAVVVNPAAGGDGDGMVAALEAVGAAEVHTVRTTGPGDARDIAYKLAGAAEPPDLIVSVGGDGTVCEVATGLFRAGEAGAGTVPPLLVAPGGTGNSVYRGLWNDEPWEKVAALALRGGAAVRTIDLARIEQNDHVVVLGSGSGLFAATLLAARNRPEKGRDLLMAAALAAMEDHEPYPGRVTVDGEVLHEGGVVETIVGGFRYRGGLLNLVPASIVDDGLLDVTVVTSAVDMAAFAQAAVLGDVYDVPGILWGRGERITVADTGGRAVLFEHDGEVMPRNTPSYDIHVVPDALTVLTAADAPPWFKEG
ncbi:MULTISPECIES: diacylglycerol/lipid kinase family protein [unclassified Streptomyces]|uniref:diacylglycerol/lipid kinase family protein n=1 Tax=unclassified Streptomyces TaxID=2593676 RepID=UPI0022720BCA|nr:MULTISPECIES: diacylglycerol kinase family protein [unclassified Streptomyces]MCY0920563.1 diacylglycerol kinase family protein [Streptomyces sp. H27-G5]MCY0957296.1 diacylglycerol kinase family protein [Streptomyces sp. H27-H5]